MVDQNRNKMILSELISET